MGSPNDNMGAKPVHRVTIKNGFYMGKYEVTQAQWQAVMGNNPSRFKTCGSNCPVDSVSWNDAQNFIKKLNETTDGFEYRLPSEAEWEYACRAGTRGDYYAADLNSIAWYVANSDKKTHPVGGKNPNAFGLYDMSGNVWEWCQDWYHGNYQGAPSDGSAWLGGAKRQYPVVRGGSWYDLPLYLGTAYRHFHLQTDDRSSVFGVRVVALSQN